MRVLVISPKDPQVPKQLKLLMGGESTYTNMLLTHPPVGITFDYFEDALRSGDISYHWSYYVLLFLQKLRILPIGPRIQAFKIHAHYDAIYDHAYPVNQISAIPIIASESSSNFIFLDQYLQLPKWYINITYFFKKILFHIFDISDGEIRSEKFDNFFVFSKWAMRIKNSEFRIQNCRVVYPGLPIPKLKQKGKRKLIKILFVGVWFERKGGRILLDVFRNLRRKFTNIELTILGELPKDLEVSKSEGITQYNFVPYKTLLEYYASHDILVHVPPEIEGYGMTVPEAMSYGMCPVVSNICVLPEFVEHMKSGLVIDAGSQKNLEQALGKLIKNPKLIRQYGDAARNRFKQKFSLPVFQKKLLTLFNSV
ncbi:glycosyltransferase [Candidatus Microgenomates bacterium]|nr:MAG: glycosyltransferase [Candidatus Microgenomates bacterium]